MPYKQKLKILASHPRKKPSYKLTNWTQYSQSLKKRGSLSLYFPWCIGSHLLTQKIESQKNEGIIIGNIINLWNSFGMCVSVKIE